MEVLAAPALCPNIVTRSGLPPNPAMLSLTNSMARCWSHSPALPGAASSAVNAKPGGNVSPLKFLHHINQYVCFDRARVPNIIFSLQNKS